MPCLLSRSLCGSRGFSLVEVMVAAVLLIIMLVGLAHFFTASGKRVMDDQTRSLLHQIASQEIENIRALPYEDVGTVNGHPQGQLLDQETTTVDGVPVEITREIVYVQDPSYSGPFPANYRRVTITVRATDSPGLAPVQVSTFVAGGAQGGSLDITVTTLSGAPVPGARLRITNDNLVPHVDIHSSAIRTDNNGHLLVPGLTPDPGGGYYVEATKTGYNPAATPQGLVVNKGTPYTVVHLIVDQLATLRVRLTDESGSPLGGVTLKASGRLSVSPWQYSVEATTGDDGVAVFSDLRYATSLEPCVVQTALPYDPPLQLPPGVDPDPIDQSVAAGLGPGQVAFMLDPGLDRQVELVLPGG